MNDENESSNPDALLNQSGVIRNANFDTKPLNSGQKTRRQKRVEKIEKIKKHREENQRQKNVPTDRERNRVVVHQEAAVTSPETKKTSKLPISKKLKEAIGRKENSSSDLFDAYC